MSASRLDVSERQLEESAKVWREVGKNGTLSALFLIGRTKRVIVRTEAEGILYEQS